ncbi:hypothetical protein Btru_069031 [Bulinus truncatus]|nr:hypothetical protein Btru_069031 [Bulinus truncatus]
MDIDDFKVGAFDFDNLLLAFIISVSFMFVLYWLWTWPCSATEEVQRKPAVHCRTVLPLQTLKPLIAFELEPGIVVLQSEDGEFFRILREYDTADRTGNGSKAPELPNCTPENRYIPSYTKGYYQTQPSAPMLHETEYNHGSDPFGSAVWTPIRTGNAAILLDYCTQKIKSACASIVGPRKKIIRSPVPWNRSHCVMKNDILSFILPSCTSE